MHTLKYAAMSMVDRASWLAISENNASENAGDDRDAVWSIANTGVLEVILVEADGLKVDPLLTSSLPDLRDDHCFPR